MSELKNYRSEVHSAVVGEKLYTGTELNVGEWFEVEPFSAIRGLLHIMRYNYEFTSLSRALPWPYLRFHIERFHRGDSLKLGSTQSE